MNKCRFLRRVHLGYTYVFPFNQILTEQLFVLYFTIKTDQKSLPITSF